MDRFIILSTQRDAEDAVTDLRDQHKIIDELLADTCIGGARESLYWTAGSVDLVLIAEFPGVSQAAACALAMRTELSAETTLLTTLDLAATATAVVGAKPATGRTARRRPATGRGIGSTEPDAHPTP
jgi:uncharacterized protein with GYD domain